MLNVQLLWINLADIIILFTEIQVALKEPTFSLNQFQKNLR